MHIELLSTTRDEGEKGGRKKTNKNKYREVALPKYFSFRQNEPETCAGLAVGHSGWLLKSCES